MSDLMQPTEAEIVLAQALAGTALRGTGPAEVKDSRIASLAYKAMSPGGRPASIRSLAKTPEKDNWVDHAGGLPKYVRMVANALVRKRGFTTQRAIATAVNKMKQWAATSDDPKIKGAAAAAVAEWHAKRKKGREKKRADLRIEVKRERARVRTPAGAARYGKPIGQFIGGWRFSTTDQLTREFGPSVSQETWLRGEHATLYEGGDILLSAQGPGEYDQDVYAVLDDESAMDLSSVLREAIGFAQHNPWNPDSPDEERMPDEETGWIDQWETPAGHRVGFDAAGGIGVIFRIPEGRGRGDQDEHDFPAEEAAHLATTLRKLAALHRAGRFGDGGQEFEPDDGYELEVDPASGMAYIPITTEALARRFNSPVGTSVWAPEEKSARRPGPPTQRKGGMQVPPRIRGRDDVEAEWVEPRAGERAQEWAKRRAKENEEELRAARQGPDPDRVEKKTGYRYPKGAPAEAKVLSQRDLDRTIKVPGVGEVKAGDWLRSNPLGTLEAKARDPRDIPGVRQVRPGQERYWGLPAWTPITPEMEEARRAGKPAAPGAALPQRRPRGKKAQPPAPGAPAYAQAATPAVVDVAPYVRGLSAEPEDMVGGSQYTAAQVDEALDDLEGEGWEPIKHLLTSDFEDPYWRDTVDAIDASMQPSTAPVRGYRIISDPEAAFGPSWSETEDLTDLTFEDAMYAPVSSDWREISKQGKKGAVMRITAPEGTAMVGMDETELMLGRGFRYRISRDYGWINGGRHLEVELIPDDTQVPRKRPEPAKSTTPVRADRMFAERRTAVKKAAPAKLAAPAKKAPAKKAAPAKTAPAKKATPRKAPAKTIGSMPAQIARAEKRIEDLRARLSIAREQRRRVRKERLRGKQEMQLEQQIRQALSDLTRLKNGEAPPAKVPTQRAPAKKATATPPKKFVPKTAEGITEAAAVRRSTKQRTTRAKGYPERAKVSDRQRRWEVPAPRYKPVEHTDETVRKQPVWADPMDHREVKTSFRSYEGEVQLDEEGRPLNPYGRTGISGRGLLGKHGPNPAADPIITRRDPKTGKLQIVLIQRPNGEWALPGGMVDFGETATQALMREFKEETGADLDMDGAKIVYQGFVDDPRNTDHAWMETTAAHKHLEGDAALVDFPGPEDATEIKGVRWADVDDDLFDTLYASHGEFLRMALDAEDSPAGPRMPAKPKPVKRAAKRTSAPAKAVKKVPPGKVSTSKTKRTKSEMWVEAKDKYNISSDLLETAMEDLQAIFEGPSPVEAGPPGPITLRTDPLPDTVRPKPAFAPSYDWGSDESRAEAIELRHRLYGAIREQTRHGITPMADVPKEYQAGRWHRVDGRRMVKQRKEAVREAMLAEFEMVHAGKETDDIDRRMFERKLDAALERIDIYPPDDVYVNGDHVMLVGWDADMPDEHREAALAQIDEMIEATPEFTQPTVVRFESDPALRDQYGVMTAAAFSALAWPAARIIYVYDDRFTGRERQGRREQSTKLGFKMPAHEQVHSGSYTLAHEWGHISDHVTRATVDDDEDDHHEHHKDDLSEYGQSNPAEGYAEAWAEWFHTYGETDNPSALAYAEKYGWKKRRRRSGKAAE